MTIENIRTLKIFDELDSTELDRVATGLTEMKYAAQEVIAREGEDISAPLCLAWQGSVAIIKGYGTPAQRELASLKAPTIFGELELITDLPFSASIVAQSDTRAWTMSRSRFHELREAGDTGIMKMIHNMARILALRLYHTNKALYEASGPDQAQLDELRKTSLAWLV